MINSLLQSTRNGTFRKERTEIKRTEDFQFEPNRLSAGFASANTKTFTPLHNGFSSRIFLSPFQRAKVCQSNSKRLKNSQWQRQEPRFNILSIKNEVNT